MQLVKVFVSVMLAAAVSAKGHDKNNGTVSTARQCRSIARMTKLVDLAANETLLEEKTGGNQTRIDAIKAEAANITTSLTVLTSNSTLIGECAVVAAYDEAVRACWEVRELEGIMALAANDTELQSVFDGKRFPMLPYPNEPYSPFR
jgi:hypothetical protein